MSDKSILTNVIRRTTTKQLQNALRNGRSLDHWGEFSFIRVSLDPHHKLFLLSFWGVWEVRGAVLGFLCSLFISKEHLSRSYQL